MREVSGMRMGTNRRGSYNNGLHQTGSRRCGPLPSSVGQSLKRAPAGEATCWAEIAGCTTTAKDAGLVPRFNSQLSGSSLLPSASRYGGQPPVSAVIPEGGKARPDSALSGQHHHLLQANVVLSNSFSAQRGSSSLASLRSHQNRNATVPPNNGLKRTSSRFSLPACRLIRC